MGFVRIWLPAIICTGGVLVIVIGRDENAYDGGAAIIGAGLSVWLLNLLFRVGVTGDHERADEDAARLFFDEHGRWPDDPPPPDPPAGSAPAPRAHPHERAPLRARPPSQRRR